MKDGRDDDQSHPEGVGTARGGDKWQRPREVHNGRKTSGFGEIRNPDLTSKVNSRIDLSPESHVLSMNPSIRSKTMRRNNVTTKQPVKILGKRPVTLEGNAFWESATIGEEMMRIDSYPFCDTSATNSR
jgi:hypothetical protein